MDLLTAMTECGARSQGLVTARRLDAAGVRPWALSAGVRNQTVIRVHRRVYALAPLPSWSQFVVTEKGPSPAYVAHVRAALLSLGVGAIAIGRTAAALRGWPMLVEPSRTVEVAVPHGSRYADVKQVKVVERRHVRGEQVAVPVGTDPVRVTSAVQTVLDCGRTLPLLEALVVCDSALRAGDVTVEELQSASRQLRGVRDAARIRRVVELCDPESGSVLETVLRVRMILGGISGFATQRILRDADGRHVLRADFVFEEVRLVVEVDGQKWHPDADRDRRRDNELAALGWRVLRYRWSDVVRDPRAVLREIRLAAGSPSSDCQNSMAGLPAAA